MSYIDKANDPRRRATALLGVGAIHAALGLAIVTGMTISGFEPFPDAPFTSKDFPLTPPPELIPDPVPTTPATASVVTAPLPPMPIPSAGPIIPVDPFDPADLVIPVTPPIPGPTGPVATPQPPMPTPTYTPTLARPRNGPTGWIDNSDYPGRPLRDEIEGTAGYRLSIGSNGRVSACEITSSTGNSQLDEATCRLITRRARFDPATDGAGTQVVGTYSGTVRWQIPE